MLDFSAKGTPEVYRFNIDTLSWEYRGNMTMARDAPGMSVVNKDDVKQYCTESNTKQLQFEIDSKQVQGSVEEEPDYN